MKKQRIRPLAFRLTRAPMILFVLSFYFTASAQPGLVNTAFYSVNEGLSYRLIRQVIQDDQGFLWLATERGVNRFDGYQFTVFNDLPGSPNPISHSDVISLGLSESSLVIIYRNNYTDFDLLDLDSYQTTKVSLLPENGISGIVRRIYVSPRGEIFVLSNANAGFHIYRYQKAGGFKLVAHLNEPREKQITVVDFLQTQEGDFLINDSYSGLKLIDTCGNLKQVFQLASFLNEAEQILFPSEIQVLHQDKQGRIWLAFQKLPGLFMLRPSGNQQFNLTQPGFLPDERYFPQVWEDKLGNLLIGQALHLGEYPDLEKLYCLKPDGALLDFSHISDQGHRITNLFSTNFFNTLFLGMDTGLKVVQNNHSKIKNFLNVNILEGSRGPVMRGITGDGRDKIFVAREVNYWYQIHLEDDRLDTLPVVDEFGTPIPLGCTMDLHLDRHGDLWGFSCQTYQGSNLIRYNTAARFAKTYSFPYLLTAFIIGSDGQLWLTGYQEDNLNNQACLASFDPVSETFQIYQDDQGKNPLQNNHPRYILQSRSGLLWIGTDNGLFSFDPKTKKTTLLRSESNIIGSENSLWSNTIYVIHEDEQENLWLGTANGLNIYNPHTEEITAFGKGTGLEGNVICGIETDDQGNYWISTYNGLFFYAPGFNAFRNFYHSDGFPNDEFNRFSFFRDHRGRLYFGGVNGFSAFYPSDLIVATSTPSLALTKITRFFQDEPAPQQITSGLRRLKTLEIGPNESYFQIHYMLPVFAKTDKNKFSAWLEGYDPDWIHLGNTPYVKYNNLPAGTYTLHLNGADPNGNWGENPIEIKIHVQQIFYKTWWFTALACLIVAFLGWSGFRYQLDQQLKVERLRTRLSSDIHDEVSGLLSGIAMQADVLKEVSQESYVQDKLQNIGEASRKAMSKMSDIIWSTDSRKDQMSDLIERMQEHADEILLKLNIPYDFRVEKMDKTSKIPVPIRQNLYFIYKEAINNIAKHADTTRVNIRLMNQGNHFQMLVHNNGYAKQNGLKKSGQGMSNIKMRAQRIHADVFFMNHDGFTVKLSMKKFT